AEICLDSGNCAGAGSGITGGGIANQIAYFDAAQNIVSSSNLFFNPATSQFGLGTSTPLAGLDVRSSSGALPIASFSGSTAFAGLVVDNGGSGDLITASKSGATIFTVTNSGDIKFTGGSGYTNTLTSQVTENKSLIIPDFNTGTTAEICLDSGNCAGAGSGITGSGVANQIAFFNDDQNITSDPSLYFDSTNKMLGIGLDSPLATLDVLGTSGTAPIANIAGNTSNASLILDNSGVGDIFAASASGQTKFVVYNNGDLGFAGTNSVLSTINSLATSARTFTLPNVSGTFCLSTNNCGFATTGENYWQKIDNLVSLNNSTYDLAIGGDTTASAKFAFINVAGGTPTATISASNGNNATYLTGGGVLGTTNAQTLTLGSATTGNVVIDSGSNITQLADNSIVFAGSAPILSSTGTLTINAFTLGGSIAGGGNNITNLTNLDLGTNNLSFNGNTITNGANNNITVTPAGSGDLILSADADSGVYIGSTGNVPAALSVSGGIGGNSAFIVNQQHVGDILTASSSGNTRFTVANNGNLSIYGGQTNPVTLTSNATAPQSIALPDETGTICLQNSTDCGFAAGINYWQQNTGLLFAGNTTVDFAIGGTSTASAAFAVTNISNGTPTATISANNGDNASYLSGNGVLGTTNAQTLTIGSPTTGNIIIDSGSGITQLSDNNILFTGSAPVLSSLNTLTINAFTL
ncbi:MAG TPA: hypothetical protein V6C65_37685, partial [Allocoleopsis sp.]